VARSLDDEEAAMTLAVVLTWTLMFTYPHPVFKGEFASKPATSTKYPTYEACRKAGERVAAMKPRPVAWKCESNGD
jgi:hypothetical protein